jgi:two-component system, cell cycle response regulator
MRLKILTVDDSKTVRIIVRKAFKPYDCEVLEASNGVEGLAIAAKEMPDLILLDVTMPVMDGVEMLTKLKADAALKAIPVMMLTAEGGRDNVLKIAKIGVRDYVVKPFKEEALIEKTSRVLNLTRLADAAAKAKTIDDPCSVLVVEDKPAIIQLIQDGLRSTPWKVQGVATQAEAFDFCTRTSPDIVLVSLSLVDESAFALFRQLRASAKHKATPIFGLVVKTETVQQQHAQTLGFNAVITKPIDMADLEAKMERAMKLDTSRRYFAIESSAFIMRLPEICSQAALADSTQYMKPKFTEAVDAGIGKAVIDIRALKGLDTGIIKHLFNATQVCHELGMQFVLVGSAPIIAECKGFEDTRGWTFYETFEEAKANLGKGAAKPAPVLASA